MTTAAISFQDRMNSTDEVSLNNTEHHATCAVENASSTTKALVILGFVLVLFSSLLGNFLLIRVTWSDKENRRKFPFSYLIINMAVADILNASSASVVFILFLVAGRLWLSGIFGQITCKISYLLVVFSVAASIFTVTTMGLDRFMAANATRRPLSKQRVKQAITVTWLLAGLLSSPYLYRMRVARRDDGKYYCMGRWSPNKETNALIHKSEEITKFVLLYIIPLLFMVFCYAMITCRIRRRCDLTLGNSRRGKIKQKNQRVVGMIVAIVVIFAFCWLPVHVNHLLRSLDYPTYCRLPAFLPLSFFWLAHANCAINPWVWFMFSQPFRHRLKKLACSSSSSPIERVRLAGKDAHDENGDKDALPNKDRSIGQ